MAEQTQLLVIGAGPGGYPAAFHAADSGMDVALVDTRVNPGGVCLFCGCIPSKALLHTARLISETKEAREFGLDFGTPKIDAGKVNQWKDNVVTKLTSNLGILSKQRKVKYIQGKATFLNSHTVKIEKTDGSKTELGFEKAVIATGSSPISLPFAPLSERIVDSTGALEIKNIPSKFLVIGGGYIGLELGTVYHELGSKVTVVEMMASILPGVDSDLSTILYRRISKMFTSILLETKVTKITDTGNDVSVTFEDKTGKSFTENFDKVLIAVGRKPNSKNFGLENTKVEVDAKGFIKVNGQRQTTEAHIYAIGDVAGNPMLAHKATHEARVAAESILGKKTAFEPKAIPAVVFTDPEIAWTGLTENEAREQNRDVTILKFPWGASGRALTLNRQEGMTKIITDQSSGRVLGVGMVGVGVSELINEGSLAIEMGAVAEDLHLTIHPHPTLSETIMEAAESFYGTSTHVFRPKKQS